jgi:hypothetical protein
MTGSLVRALIVSAALSLSLAIPAHAALVLDQHQQVIDTSLGSLVVGGAYSQRLAQSWTVGIHGRLAEIRLPIACASGTLVLEIVELRGGFPTGRVLRTETVPAADLPLTMPPVFQTVEISPPIPMGPSDQYAFVLANPTGSCGLWRSETAEYARGQGFFNDEVNGFRWISFKEFPEGTQDLSFETWMEVPGGLGGDSSSLCEVDRFGRIPVPGFVPLCRCLESDFPREQRCTFLHPDFMLLRRIPLPLIPGKTINVQWTLMPHEQLQQPIAVTDLFPDAFGGKPVTLLFDTRQIPAAQTLTLGYDATALFDTRAFKLETEIIFGEAKGTMRTILDVEKE